MAERRDSMVVVAVDTSTDMLACGVGRVTGAPERGLEMLSSGDHLCRRHANVELVNTVDAALKGAALTIDDVDALLVGRGPGSFTGVRIGISTAKGMARGAGHPLFGVSTLDATAWTAWRAGTRGLLGVAADAMRGEVYPAVYRLDDAGAHRLFDRERVVKAAAAVAEWGERPDAAELQLTGDGLVRHGALFEGAGLMARALDRELWWPTGEGLLLAWAASHGRTGGAGEDGDPALVLPIYTRLSDAEENERKRLGLEQSPASEVTMPRRRQRSSRRASKGPAIRHGRLRSSFQNLPPMSRCRAPGGSPTTTASLSAWRAA